jgi:purine-binding chemotaxis protein CheW
MAVLVVRAGALRCALPVECVEETLRLPPLLRLAGLPDFVLGAALLRGAPAPVVDLARLLGGESAADASRAVLLRAGSGRIALAVSELLGVRELPRESVELPPLLQGARPELVQALAKLDDALLIVLHRGWSLPEAVWAALDSGRPGA